MTKTDAIEQAIANYNAAGGRWHVVGLDGEYYDVHDYWLQRHPDVVSEFVIGEVVETTTGKKLSVARKAIFKFNIFLLWLTKRLRDAREDNRKT